MKYIKQFIVGIALVLTTALAVTVNGQARTPFMPSQGGTGTSTNPTYGQVLVGNAQGTYTLTATSSLGITGGSGGSGTVNSGTTGQFPYYAGAGTTLTATSVPFLSTASKLGVGTTTPSALLDIYNGANTNTGLYVEAGTGGVNIAQFARRSGGTADVKIHASASNPSITFGYTTLDKYTIGYDSVNTGFAISTTGGLPGTNVFILKDTTGNVGIGTTSPSGILELSAGTSGINDRVRFITSGGASNRTLDFDRSLAAGGWSIQSRLTNSTSVAANLMLNPVGGNVGIGTTTPGQLLSVAGDILGNNIIGSYFTGTSTATSTIKGVVVLSPDGTYMSGAPNSPLTMYTTGYIGPWQTKIVNRSTSNFALSGMTIAGDKYVDNGFSSSYYGGLYFASSNYNVPGFNGVKANGVALVASDGALTIGSATSSLQCGVRLQAGGFDDNQLDGCISGVTGNWGIGATTTPYALMSIHQFSNKTSRVLFAVASSTATATTTLFQIDNTGTTTAANGFNITNGCFSINNSCVGGSGGSGTVGSGTAGQTTYYAGSGTTLTATSSVFINSSTSDVFIGTTTVSATSELTVHNSATRTNIIQGYSGAGAQVYALINNGNTSQSGSITAVSGANALTLDSSGFSMAGGSVIPRILFGAANVNSPRLARANLTSSVLLLNNGSGTQTAGGFSIGSSTPSAFVTFSTSSPATVSNWLFAIASTTRNVSTSTSFLVDGLGQVGIGTSTNAGTLSIESNSGTTTVYVGSSAKPSCIQYYAQNGTAYRQYMSNAGTLVTEAGACK